MTLPETSIFYELAYRNSQYSFIFKGLGVRFPAGARIFLFACMFRSVLLPNQPLTQWIVRVERGVNLTI
jgi:hypothetical protein